MGYPPMRRGVFVRTGSDGARRGRRTVTGPGREEPRALADRAGDRTSGDLGSGGAAAQPEAAQGGPGQHMARELPTSAADLVPVRGSAPPLASPMAPPGWSHRPG